MAHGELLILHTEGAFDQNGIYSEDRMTQLMEMKVKLAESAKDSVAGHFMWLLTSHDNPEGYRAEKVIVSWIVLAP
jgi:hypothetical protein